MRRCSLRWCLYLKAFPHWLHLNFLFSIPLSDKEFWDTHGAVSTCCVSACVSLVRRVLLYLLVALAVERQVPLHLSAVRRTEPAERADAVSSVPVLAELHMFPQRRVTPVRPLAIRARLNGRLRAVGVQRSAVWGKSDSVQWLINNALIKAVNHLSNLCPQVTRALPETSRQVTCRRERRLNGTSSRTRCAAVRESGWAGATLSSAAPWSRNGARRRSHDRQSDLRETHGNESQHKNRWCPLNNCN